MNECFVESTHQRGENVIDIIGNLRACIENNIIECPQYFILGGVAVAALTDPETRFDLEKKRIIPPKNLRKDQYRENGTLGDIDILVDTLSTEKVDQIRQAIEPDDHLIEHGTIEQISYEKSKPGYKQKIGVTPLVSQKEYLGITKNPLKRLTKIVLKDFVSERVVDHKGRKSWRLADIQVDITDGYFEPWEQELPNGETIPVLHPVLQMACYPGRPSHGIRKRDVEKVQKIEKVVGPAFAVHLEWGDRNRTLDIVSESKKTQAYDSAIEFVHQKNELNYRNNKNRMGRRTAAWFALKQTLHRPADTYLAHLGQEGWLYDHVLSKASGERQQKIKR